MNLDDNDYVDFEEIEPENKNNTRTIIIVVAAVVLLCCCCLVTAWYGGDYVVNFLQGY